MNMCEVEVMQRIANLHELDQSLEWVYNLFYQHETSGEAVNYDIRIEILATRIHVIKLLTGAVQQLHTKSFEIEQADEHFTILNSETRELFHDSDAGHASDWI